MARTIEDVFAFWSENAEEVEECHPYCPLVSDDEIAAMTADVPQVLRDSLTWAFFSLEHALRRHPEIQDGWRDLVAAYRADTALTHDVGAFEFPDGEIVEVPLRIDRLAGFRYKAIDDEVARLVSTLDKIENFNPEEYQSTLVESSYQSKRRMGVTRPPTYDPQNIERVLNEVEAKCNTAIVHKSATWIIQRVEQEWPRVFRGTPIENAVPGPSTLRKAIKKKFSK